MSRKLLAFLLSELTTVRIVCRGKTNSHPCGRVVEMPIIGLRDFYRNNSICPSCGTRFQAITGPMGNQDPFGPLGEAILQLDAMTDRVEVEFVIPLEEKQP